MTQITAKPVAHTPHPQAPPPFKQILLLGGIPDHLNRNLPIRDSVADAFADILGPDGVHVTSLVHARSHIDRMSKGFVLIFGSAMSDESDYAALAYEAHQRGCPVVVWLTEDPYEFDVGYKFIDLADLVFTNDAWSRAFYHRSNVFHLPLAASKRLHYREVLTNDADYVCDIFFCGVGFQNRRCIMDGLRPILSQYDTVICGAEWEENAPYISNHRLDHDELLKYYQRSRIVLNLPREFSYANDRFQITPSTPGPRTFEAAMSGAFQMIFADRPEIMDYYDLDREIVMFSGLADFEEQVRCYLENPQERIAVARAGQQRTLRDHQYANRVQKILSHLDAWMSRCMLMGRSEHRLPLSSFQEARDCVD